MTDFYGLPTRAISNRHIQAEYLAEAGLRLIRVMLKNSARPENVLAETPHVSWPTPHGAYFLRGGHRLWHAPEAAPRSSIPEPPEIEVSDVPDGVCLTQPTEPTTGIRKRLEIHLAPDRPAMTLFHTLQNDGLWPVELAPWAITQLALGGVAILPQPRESLDPHSLRPNRCLVLWPYTTFADPRVELHDDHWLVHGQSQLPPCKIGYLNRHGWAGYLRNGTLLIKRFRPEADKPHPDDGCNTEVYCNDLSLELETLGALCSLAPGQSTTHVEQWEFLAADDTPATREGIERLVGRLPPEYLAPPDDVEPVAARASLEPTGQNIESSEWG